MLIFQRAGFSHFRDARSGFPPGRLYISALVSTLKDFSFLRKFLQLQGEKKEIQNRRKYEGNFKKLKKIEKTLANVTLCHCVTICVTINIVCNVIL